MTYKPYTNLSPEIFRAYDIRGIVDDTLTPDIVYTLGLAIGSEAQARGEKQIITARDGRLSGPLLHAALNQGLQDSGCDIIDIGAIPTPVLYFATYTLNTSSGVMLTGSHNPSNYNGLKIVLAGETLSDKTIYALYERIQARRLSHGSGTLQKRDVATDYIQRITQDVHFKRSLRVVVDAGNGIAAQIAPRLIRALGCEVTELFCEVDGRFPHHHPDPSVPENLHDLIIAVKKQKADIGLAFDGDADRVGVVTNQGEIIWPDRLLMLLATDVLARNPGAMIIYDIKSSRYVADVIKQHGGQPLMWKTGHSLVKAKLRETGALLAGEMSGHVFFKERWYGFDDGIYTAVRLLEVLAQDARDASTIFSSLPNSVNTPELKLPIAEEQKFLFMEKFAGQAVFDGATITTIDGVRADFNEGWGLVRPSNTSPYLVLRFEADTQADLVRIQNIFREQLLAIDKNLHLPF
jgi:phosphomannomutase / phosphoglucomutase